MTVFRTSARHELIEILGEFVSKRYRERVWSKQPDGDPASLSEAIEVLDDWGFFKDERCGSVHPSLRDRVESNAVSKFARALNDLLDSAGHGTEPRQLLSHPKFECVVAAARVAHKLLLKNDRADPPVYLYSMDIKPDDIETDQQQDRDPILAQILYALPRRL